MQFYKSNVQVGHKTMVVAMVDVALALATKKEYTAPRLHHIHILDRSGSMCSDIDRLVDNVQRTIDLIAEDDLLSIIWFNSPGQFRTLIKGARKTDELKALLDEMRSAGGKTCFSEPFKEAHTIIKELKALCANVSITLFTDGCAVVPWGEAEENRRVIAELKSMRNDILACNTVGYGCRYNQDFLKQVACESDFGTFVHSRDINEYWHIFQHNFERVTDTALGQLQVEHSGDIVYLNTNFTKMTNMSLDLCRLDKQLNYVFLVGERDFEFVCDGIKYSTQKIQSALPDAIISDFLYAYAYNCYYVGRRQVALDILAHNLMDKYLLELQMKAFTFDEVADYLQELQGAVFAAASRYKQGKCKRGVLPAPDAHNVMDVLSALAANNAYYLPDHAETDSYERIGKKVVDRFDLFKANQDIVLGSFDDLVFHKSKINVSIRMQIKGKVQINPKDAAQYNLPTEFDSHIYRTHTIIKDGDLHLKKFAILLPTDLYQTLLAKQTKLSPVTIAAEVLAKLEQEHKVPYMCAVLDLRGLPMINRAYLDASMAIENVFELCHGMLELEGYQKVVKFYIDKIVDVSAAAKKERVFQDYTAAQIKVLENHGIDASGAYRGVDNAMAQKQDCDSYEAKSMEFVFKGISKLPSVSELEQRLVSGAKLTAGLQVLKQGYDKMLSAIASKQKCRVQDIEIPLAKKQLNVALKRLLDAELCSIKNELMLKRTKLNAIKMAKVLTGDWFEGLSNDEKGHYVYEKDGAALLLKTEMVTEYF